MADTGWCAGLYQDGVDARSQALGGAATSGASQSALEALDSNPATLSLVQPAVVNLGGSVGWIQGEFKNRSNPDAHMNQFGAIPDAAVGATFGKLSVGLGFITESAMRDEWNYRDSPGGLGGATTYGTRTNLSSFELLRFALGASYALTPQLSFGADANLLYNDNRLKAPYVIQSQRQLAGAKTLLDLETSGWGDNGAFGALWRPLDNLRVGVSYTMPSRIWTSGHASSDASVQLANLGLRGVNASTNFDAAVLNDLPQMVSGGFSWRIVPRLEVTSQLDWINWENAFDSLEVRLRNTDNKLYQTLLAGKNHFDDNVPLNWRNQWVPRIGLEYQVFDHFFLRAGYRYARNPVPDTTLTPLTAAISEHVLTAGVGYQSGRFSCDLAFQYYLPTTQHIGTSDLLTGEYSNSSIRISIEQLTCTVGVQF